MERATHDASPTVSFLQSSVPTYRMVNSQLMVQLSVGRKIHLVLESLVPTYRMVNWQLMGLFFRGENTS